MFGSGPPPRGRGGPRGRGAPRGRGRGRGVPPPPPGKSMNGFQPLNST